MRRLSGWMGGVLVLAACTASREAAPCRHGIAVQAERGMVCVFRRDQPLVIEGGFSCPADFGFRIDGPGAIACSSFDADALPREVCTAVPGACEPAGEAPARPATPEDGGASREPSGPELAECVKPCASPADCVVRGDRTRDEDNYACRDGGCIYLGCYDDSECSMFGELCRTDPYGRRCVRPCETTSECVDGERSETGASRADLGLIECVDGGCAYVGCKSDANCPFTTQCIVERNGVRDCARPCESPDDCARLAQLELGLDGPHPNDPWTHAEGFVCLSGICWGNVPSCTRDDECSGLASDAVCRVPPR